MRSESEIRNVLRYLHAAGHQRFKNRSTCDTCGQEKDTYTSIFKDKTGKRRRFTGEAAILVLDDMFAAERALHWLLLD
jgi:hypothetical protein